MPRNRNSRHRRPVDVPHHEELRHRSTDDAQQVIDEVAACAEQLLDIAAKHVQRQHVEEQVRRSRMQKAVGEELPGAEGRRAGKLVRSERPEREARNQQGPGQELQPEDHDVGDQERLGDAWHAADKHPCILSESLTGRGLPVISSLRDPDRVIA